MDCFRNWKGIHPRKKNKISNQQEINLFMTWSCGISVLVKKLQALQKKLSSQLLLDYAQTSHCGVPTRGISVPWISSGHSGSGWKKVCPSRVVILLPPPLLLLLDKFLFSLVCYMTFFGETSIVKASCICTKPCVAVGQLITGLVWGPGKCCSCVMFWDIVSLLFSKGSQPNQHVTWN